MGYSLWGCKKLDMTKQLSGSRFLETVHHACVDRCCGSRPRFTLHHPNPGHSFPSCSEGFQQNTFPESSQGIASIQKNLPHPRLLPLTR